MPTNKSKRDSLDYELLSLLETETGLPQRQIAVRLGTSLGTVNARLKELLVEGFVRVLSDPAAGCRFRNVYALTPAGVDRRTSLTRGFLDRKIAECEHLKIQIELLLRDLSRQ